MPIGGGALSPKLTLLGEELKVLESIRALCESWCLYLNG